MRLLCDEMLHRLGRWLRAAGYDTAFAAAGAEDSLLMEQAIAEQRWLITRDRGFLERRRAADYVVFLKTEDPDLQARQLSVRLGIDWLYRPFSRCLLCNRELVAASPEQRPADVAGEVYYCTGCRRLYWEGGHVQRMRQRLGHWQAAGAAWSVNANRP